MNMYLDLDRMRVVCNWDEPREVVLNKDTFTIGKKRTASLRISRTGTLNKQDVLRADDDPKVNAVRSFINTMKKQKLLPMKQPEERVCAICGSTERVFPHLHPSKKGVVWLCGRHRYSLEHL